MAVPGVDPVAGFPVSQAIGSHRYLGQMPLQFWDDIGRGQLWQNPQWVMGGAAPGTTSPLAGQLAGQPAMFADDLTVNPAAVAANPVAPGTLAAQAAGFNPYASASYGQAVRGALGNALRPGGFPAAQQAYQQALATAGSRYNPARYSGRLAQKGARLAQKGARLWTRGFHPGILRSGAVGVGGSLLYNQLLQDPVAGALEGHFGLDTPGQAELASDVLGELAASAAAGGSVAGVPGAIIAPTATLAFRWLTGGLEGQPSKEDVEHLADLKWNETYARMGLTNAEADEFESEIRSGFLDAPARETAALLGYPEDVINKIPEDYDSVQLVKDYFASVMEQQAQQESIQSLAEQAGLVEAGPSPEELAQQQVHDQLAQQAVIQGITGPVVTRMKNEAQAQQNAWEQYKQTAPPDVVQSLEPAVENMLSGNRMLADAYQMQALSFPNLLELERQNDLWAQQQALQQQAMAQQQSSGGGDDLLSQLAALGATEEGAGALEEMGLGGLAQQASNGSPWGF